MSGSFGPIGGDVGGTAPPQEFYVQGVMEIAFETLVDLADLRPGSVRTIRKASNPLGQWNAVPPNRNNTIPRSLDILASGAQLLPCISTDDFASVGAFTDYLTSWSDALDAHADNPPVWWEVGNEPQTGATQLAARDRYLTYLKAAATALHARGKKVMICAFITQGTGGSSAVYNQIDAGGSGAHGVTWADIDGMAAHCYAQQGDKDNPIPANSAYKNTGVMQAVHGMRNFFDTYGDLDTKPLFLTEFGFSCAYRVDGLQHGDWSPGQPGMSNGTTGQENRVIGLALQSQLVQAAFNAIRDDRGKSDLYCLGAWCYAYHDFGIPNGTWDRHCGAVDAGEGRRPLYDTLKALRGSYPMIP